MLDVTFCIFCIFAFAHNKVSAGDGVPVHVHEHGKVDQSTVVLCVVSVEAASSNGICKCPVARGSETRCSSDFVRVMASKARRSRDFNRIVAWDSHFDRTVA